MKRRLLPFTAAMLAVALIANGAVAAPEREVRTTGDERVVPNVMIQATIRFTPGPISVNKGDEVTWTDDDVQTAPHTATIVEEFPESEIGAIFGCGAPTEPCGQALAAHGVSGPVVDVGDPGFNEPGDSLMFFDSTSPPQFPDSISAVVTAEPGTTLKYLCAIHPWMQGTIKVR